MKVRFIKCHDRRWRWRLANDRLCINMGSTQTFWFKWKCRSDFKKRYSQMAKKRAHWPPLHEVMP